MTRMRAQAALWIGRLVMAVLRLAGRRGTSLPGLIASRVSPELLFRLLDQLEQCVVVTGTNGKTTTSALLYSMLEDDRRPWLTNRGGANLLQGLLAALLPHVDRYGRLRVRRAVLEVDEATLPLMTAHYHPTLIVVTNVVRDQLDRYGEVDGALEMLRSGLLYPGTTLLANADDPLAASLGRERELTYYYGMEECPMDEEPRNEVRDGAFCLLCGQELRYERYIYGQLGYYSCDRGHFDRPEPHFGGRTDGVSAVTVRERGANERGEEFPVQAGVLGLYNDYNVLAAAAAARLLGRSPRQIQEGAKHYEAPLGRMQMFPGSPERILALIKNPTGANSVLRALEADERDKAVCFAINDADADGRDVSWLWDIDLEWFVSAALCQHYICAGTRALDMAVRLAYAGVDRGRIRIAAELSDLVSMTAELDVPVYVLSTYTALHPLGEHLRSDGPGLGRRIRT